LQFWIFAVGFCLCCRLLDIEAECLQCLVPHEKLLSELDSLEGRVEKIAVPLSYADQLYSLKSHIDLVRSRLKSST
jgi:hypothetical protein